MYLLFKKGFWTLYRNDKPYIVFGYLLGAFNIFFCAKVCLFHTKYHQNYKMNFFYKNNETDALKDLLGPKSLYVYAKRKKVIKKTYSEILDIIEHMKLLKQELPDTTFSLDNKLLIMKAGDFIPSLVSADELFLIARIMLKAPVSELILEKKKDFCKFLIQIASLKGSDLAMLYIAEKKMKSGSSSELHEALYIYRNLSIKGNTKALLVLGNLSLKLNNNKQAERFYLKSIEGGNSDAMVSLAVLKKRMGEDKEAKYWFIRASEMGKF